MKVAISLPDSLYDRAEILALELGVSRSKLYARALEALLSGDGTQDVTAQMNAALDLAGTSDDRLPLGTVRRVLAHTEW